MLLPGHAGGKEDRKGKGKERGGKEMEGKERKGKERKGKKRNENDSSNIEFPILSFPSLPFPCLFFPWVSAHVRPDEVDEAQAPQALPHISAAMDVAPLTRGG